MGSHSCITLGFDLMEEYTVNRKSISLILLLGFALFVGACGSDEVPNLLAPFEPEIVNNADSFQFQITGATNVTVIRSYVWTNITTGATINHSTTHTDGTGTVVVLDAEGTEVYRSSLKASGTEQSQTGMAGAWMVQVIFSNFDGTANFRIEKL